MNAVVAEALDMAGSKRATLTTVVPGPGPQKRKRRTLGQTRDLELKWVLKTCGAHMETWRVLAHRWMQVQTRGFDQRKRALGLFLEDYLHAHGFHDPEEFLRRGMPPRPAFYGEGAACPKTRAGLRYNNDVHHFIDWILKNAEPFSEDEAGADRITVPGYFNPVPRLAHGIVRYSESVRMALPYKFIEELRTILAPGSHFRDWTWAQAAVGDRFHRGSGDWFEVDDCAIDQSDPDCVWRRRDMVVRRRTSGHSLGTHSILELWSPVRSVALLVKLTLPLRTYQVRVLDSGEADTDRCEARGSDQSYQLVWGTNPGRLQSGDAKHPVRRGVFRKLVDPHTGESNTGFFINTNKTADLATDPDRRGYVMPWQHETLLRWLVKLRAWQEKYNPIKTPSRWTELERRHIGHTKSASELEAMPPTCFLFRDPVTLDKKDRAYPIADHQIEGLWHKLLGELERRCDLRGERLGNGEKLRFIARIHHRGAQVPFYPLHSLRVSLLTALALDGGVPLPVLSKLVAGHSRLLMTIYYIKVGPSRITAVLNEGEKQMRLNAARSLTLFLQEKPYDEMASVVAAVDEASMRMALAEDPAQRNAVGWAPVHLGMCMAGGNTSPIEQTKTVGGCYNGGELLKPAREPGNRCYAPVRGGARNCGACRWLVTEPHHLPRWVAHYNNVSYHVHEVAKRFRAYEEKLTALRTTRYEAQLADQPFSDQAESEEVARLHEGAAAEMDRLLADARDAIVMIIRLQNLLKTPGGASQQLVAAGEIADIKCVLEETSSELLQLAGICEDAEIYPDLSVGKAVVRRSQFLDQMLAREGQRPIFLTLDEQTQHTVGNRLLRELARSADARNPVRGLRLATAAIERGEHVDWAAETIKRIVGEPKPDSTAATVRRFTKPLPGSSSHELTP